jgi:hypothetical protein
MNAHGRHSTPNNISKMMMPAGTPRIHRISARIGLLQEFSDVSAAASGMPVAITLFSVTYARMATDGL